MRGLTLATPALLCLVGLLLSMEYKGEKYRPLLRVFQCLALAVAAVNAACWFAALSQPFVLAVSIAAIVVNLPLAALGMSKKID